MIWATVTEVRAWWENQQTALGVTWTDLPSSDPAVQILIDSAARTLGTRVIRWPVLDDAGERAVDAVQRGHIVVAVGEVIRARREAVEVTAALGGAGAAAVIAGGGSITASKLSVSGSKQSGGGVQVGESAVTVPLAAYDALSAANLIGGSVASW
jgi:hypothetical protein